MNEHLCPTTTDSERLRVGHTSSEPCQTWLHIGSNFIPHAMPVPFALQVQIVHHDRAWPDSYTARPVP